MFEEVQAACEQHTQSHQSFPLLSYPEEDNTRLPDFNSHLLSRDLLLHRFHTAGRSASFRMRSIKEKVAVYLCTPVNDSCFRPSGLEPAGMGRSEDTKALSRARPAQRTLRTGGIATEVVVYQQCELLTYYPVCLMCPSRRPEKTACYANGPLT